ncbi:MAG: LiaF transmembrane domain-containing protein [Marinilabiliaceae bacterium]
MTSFQKPQATKKSGHSTAGIVLILLGTILLVGNMGLIPDSLWGIIFQWPSIFGIIAIINLINRKYTPALIFAIIWGLFIWPDIFPHLQIEVGKLWPVLLILVGILFIHGHQKRRKRTFIKSGETGSNDQIEEIAIFGENIRRIETDHFKGGEVTSIFGGNELYFNNSRVAPGGAVMQIVNIFGGTKIVVPRDWNIQIEVVSILGGFADKRIYNPGEAPSGQTLKIKGVAIFGGGEIANY